MTQTFVIGAIHGLTIGLLAVGLVLVYKANRFINLAHTQLGAMSAVLLAKFVLDWHVNWWLALPLVVAVGVGTGMAVERWIIRPLRNRRSSTESLLLVSLGVSQVLLALVFVKALRPSGDRLQANGYPMPFHAKLRIAGLVLNADSILIVITVPLMVAALAVFLRYSLLGKMIRAAASNPEAARLCGISIGRVSGVTWAVAGGLSALTAILIAPSHGSFDAVQLGPDLLLRSLGAAALGGFVSIPAACIGGIGLGLIDQYTQYFTHDGSEALLVVFLVILGIFLVRGRTISAGAASHVESFNDRAPLRIPASLRDHFLVRRQRSLLALPSLAIAAVLPLLPYFRTDAHRFELTLVVIYALIGVALTMVVGWAGQVSLGHFALVGVGAFMAARMSHNQWSLPMVLLAAGLAGAAVLVVAGVPALRLRGLTMAVTTLGVAVVANAWLFRKEWFGSVSPYGLLVTPIRIGSNLGEPRDYGEVYYVALAVLCLVLLGASAIRRSLPGRIVLAVRDNESAAAAFGITPATVKLGILAVSGFVAGAAGVLWAEAWRNVSNQQFSPALSFAVVAVPVIGGLGSLAGAVAGAIFLYFPTYFLTPLIPEGLLGSLGREVAFQLALGGASLIVVTLSYPTGIAGVAHRAWERFLGAQAKRQASRPTPEIHPPLIVEGVDLSFGGVKALDEVSIHVDEGEIVGLIGANGAGKTTLLNVISGALQAKRGRVRVYGNEVADLPAEYRSAYGLGRSFQSARLFPGLTVLETVQVALAQRNRVGFVSTAIGAPWARSIERSTRAEAEELVERLNLTMYADALTSELSTGTRRICDLAAQLAARPKVLLLDEPTAGIAQRECEMFPPLLRRIRDEMGCSILIVEHDMPMLMNLCDRVYALEIGRVIAEGTPAEVRDDPAVIASYLGSNETAINRSGAADKRRPRRSALRATTDSTEELVP